MSWRQPDKPSFSWVSFTCPLDDKRQFPVVNQSLPEWYRCLTLRHSGRMLRIGLVRAQGGVMVMVS